MNLTNQEAHKQHEIFKHLCEQFNSHGFLEDSPAMLKMYQDSTIQCWELFNWLRDKELTEATQAYCIGCGKILIRLSYLIHEGRKETQDEFAKTIVLYTGNKTIESEATT